MEQNSGDGIGTPPPPQSRHDNREDITPAERQPGRLEDIFRRTPTQRAWPGEETVPASVRCCNGKITLTSRAAGQPRPQRGEQDVSRMGTGTGHQTGSLLRGSQGCILGSAEEHITNCIVSHDAISIATTANLVVPEAVHGTPGRSRHYRGGGHVASISDNSETLDHGDGELETQ